MSRVDIRICDLCKVEKRSDEGLHHSYWDISPIHLNMKGHVSIQTEWVLDCCGSCANKIKNDINKSIEELKPKENV